MEQTNQHQQFQCTGDCLNCRAVNDRRIQWQYCAAQFSYNSFRTIQAMQESVNAMAGEVRELKEKIASIENNEAEIFIPSLEEKEEGKAQEGDGAT
jgi:hypothetical protein